MLIHYKQKQITNNLKQNAKMNNRMIQITDAKVRGFWADSKKLARILSKLLRQGKGFATELGKRVRLCRKGHKKRAPLSPIIC